MLSLVSTVTLYHNVTKSARERERNDKFMAKKSNSEELANRLKKEYYKDWRDKNKDKVKKYNATYWKKRAEKAKQNPLLSKLL